MCLRQVELLKAAEHVMTVTRCIQNIMIKHYYEICTIDQIAMLMLNVIIDINNYLFLNVPLFYRNLSFFLQNISKVKLL